MILTMEIMTMVVVTIAMFRLHNYMYTWALAAKWMVAVHGSRHPTLWPMVAAPGSRRKSDLQGWRGNM